MSNWTHVAGIIRLDSFRFNGEPDFDKLFGKELQWNSDESEWVKADECPEKYLPVGSEGSLSKTIWVNPDKSHIPAYTVSIFGDLRDHESAKSIIEWFKEKCKLCNSDNTHVWVRQATITASNEFYGTESWTYEEEGS